MEFIFITYLLVSSLAVWRTYAEQREAGISSPVFVAMGYLLCITWPVTVVVFASCKAFQRA